MLVFSANLMQIFSPLVLEHFPQRKKLLILMRLIIQTMNIVLIGCIPFCPFERQAKLVIFGALVLTLERHERADRARLFGLARCSSFRSASACGISPFSP